MLFYVYFDGYGQVKSAVNEYELKQFYENDKNRFYQAMIELERKNNVGYIAGHVGTINCNNIQELNEFLASLGDEIEGLYEGQMDARPYNF